MRKSSANAYLILILAIGLVPATVAANPGPSTGQGLQGAPGYWNDRGAPAVSIFQREQDAIDVQQRFTDAVRRADIPAAVAMLTEDATWAGTGQCAQVMCVGKMAIGAEIAQEVANHIRITALSVTANGTQVIQRAELRFDGLPVGIERITGTAIFTIFGDMIVSFRFVPDPDDPQTLAFLKIQATRNFIRRLGDG